MASMTAANVLRLTDAVPAQVVDGPLRPMRINGRLAWPVSELRRVLGVA